ncbi:hypothetical protein [Anthocerotibacter panamensis]|uniref:hypothetical protein n=1 Tax=Anthocerotibacter panamensis TaxID=2857077 RepID=UPI001C403ABE|nr:hypothetical protein [Anthocerotibacter panamensis]
MHDWTLLTISFAWELGEVQISFSCCKSQVKSLLAEGVVDLHIPRLQEWGPSISVNTVTGPLALSNGIYELRIEMQSGDLITIIAGKFIFPSLD